MNLTPPLLMIFRTPNSLQVARALAGMCPHCPEVHLAKKHACDAIKFLECPDCGVVVALENA